MKIKDSTKSTLTQAMYMLAAEVIISLIIVGVYSLIGRFSYKVVTGVVLGSAVTVTNFLILTISVNRAIDAYIEKREALGEVDEETAQKFAEENSASVRFAATKSYVLRTMLMLATFIVAFVVEQFDVIATLIPLLAYRPIIYVCELILKKRKE